MTNKSDLENAVSFFLDAYDQYIEDYPDVADAIANCGDLVDHIEDLRDSLTLKQELAEPLEAFGCYEDYPEATNYDYDKFME